MENKKLSLTKSAMTYGLYLGLALIIFSLITYVTGLIGNKAVSFLSYVIYIGMIAFAMVNFRGKENGGILKYGQGVGLGTLTSVVGGVLSSIFMFILFKYIDPSLIEHVVNQAMEEALQKGAPEEHLAEAEKWIRIFTSPTAMLVIGIIGSAFFGLIISLILAAIFKKEPSVFDNIEAEEA